MNEYLVVVSRRDTEDDIFVLSKQYVLAEDAESALKKIVLGKGDFVNLLEFLHKIHIV